MCFILLELWGQTVSASPLSAEAGGWDCVFIDYGWMGLMSNQASVVTAVGPVRAWTGLLQRPAAPVAILRRGGVNDGR